MKIEIGDYEIYSSGTIITNKDEDNVKFFIEDLLFEFLFKNDTKDTKQNLGVQQIEGTKGIRLEFKNFNNSLGTGNTQPILLGNLGPKSLYLNFRVYAMIGDKGISGKTIHYTWLTKINKDEHQSN